jgi:uncharacterized protein
MATTCTSRKLAGALIVMGLSALPASAAQQTAEKVLPSFDCHHTTTVAERVFFTHQELPKLDVEMIRLFRDAVNQAPSDKRKDLHTEQARWIARRNDCGESDDATVQKCIERSYRERIAELRQK